MKINHLFSEPFINIFSKENCIFFKEPSFTQLYNELISEDYNIFPVPKLLLNDMLNFALTNKPLAEKCYLCEDILNNYIVDWKYYNEFKNNIKLMLKENLKCSITIKLYSNKSQLLQILKKYSNQEIYNKILSQDVVPSGIAYSYSDNFEICIAININKKDKFKIFKTIQHELIHWMQISLNSHTNKSYGIFPKLKITLNPIQKQFLYQLGVDHEYVLSEYEFEPWVANTCEEFTLSKITIDKFKTIVENNELFVNEISNCNSQGMYEMFVFGKICFIVSKTSNDDFYYYLIEALKEN